MWMLLRIRCGIDKFIVLIGNLMVIIVFFVWIVLIVLLNVDLVIVVIIVVWILLIFFWSCVVKLGFLIGLIKRLVFIFFVKVNWLLFILIVIIFVLKICLVYCKVRLFSLFNFEIISYWFGWILDFFIVL